MKRKMKENQGKSNTKVMEKRKHRSKSDKARLETYLYQSVWNHALFCEPLLNEEERETEETLLCQQERDKYNQVLHGPFAIS
jgi:superoxide dismutase